MSEDIKKLIENINKLSGMKVSNEALKLIETIKKQVVDVCDILEEYRLDAYDNQYND